MASRESLRKACCKVAGALRQYPAPSMSQAQREGFESARRHLSALLEDRGADLLSDALQVIEDESFAAGRAGVDEGVSEVRQAASEGQLGVDDDDATQKKTHLVSGDYVYETDPPAGQPADEPQQEASEPAASPTLIELGIPYAKDLADTATDDGDPVSILTLDDYRAFVASHGSIVAVSGIGPSRAAKIEAAIAQHTAPAKAEDDVAPETQEAAPEAAPESEQHEVASEPPPTA